MSPFHRKKVPKEQACYRLTFINKNLPFREAALTYRNEKGFDPSLAIALDTKGPEIRTGLLEGDDGRKEIVWEAGDIVKLTTDEEYKEKCTKEIVYVDYKNISKVIQPGKRIFIDDGLISIKATEIGESCCSEKYVLCFFFPFFIFLSL